MFGPDCIHPSPLVEKRGDTRPVFFPRGFQKVKSEWLWKSMERDSIESLVAARFYPNKDLCVFKILYRNNDECTSIYTENITFAVLKRLWDQKNGGLNSGIRYYLLNSPEASHQYLTNRTIHDLENLLWYKKVVA